MNTVDSTHARKPWVSVFERTSKVRAHKHRADRRGHVSYLTPAKQLQNFDGLLCDISEKQTRTRQEVLVSPDTSKEEDISALQILDSTICEKVEQATGN